MPGTEAAGRPDARPNRLTVTGSFTADPRPHVVIIGGGFGGLSVARELADANVRITLLDRTNHHLFQPLLYQVATAVLHPADIAVPIRWVLRRQPNVTVVMAEVSAIDPRNHTVSLDGGSTTLTFDYLVVAAGARHAYFGHDDWEQHAPGLKSLEDALEMRRRFLLSFEAAERASAEGERDALLTFVIVGAGPTGVELAGMVPEVMRSMQGEFRRINPARARVLLLEGGPRVLPTFPEDLSAKAQRALEQLGVTVMTNTIVSDVDEGGVVANGERIPAHTVFWGAGNQASPLVAQLGGPVDRAGRALVTPDCSVEGQPNIFVIGDAAATFTDDGKPVPAVAPAANQMGKIVGKNIRRELAGTPRETFRYFNKGDLATIGRHRAVAVLAGRKLSGTFAWLTWLFVHILYLAGAKNRLSVFVTWVWAYITRQRGVRIITGETVHRLLRQSREAERRRAA